MYWFPSPNGTCLLSHFTMSKREKLGDSFDPVLRVHLSYLTNFTLSQFCSPQTMLLSIFLQHRDLSPASYVCVSILWASLGSSSHLHTVCTLPVITMAFYLLFPCVCVYKHASMCCTYAHFACLLDIVCGQISGLSVSRELSPVSLSVKADSRGKNVETLQKPCFIYVPIGGWIKSVVKVLVAETSV